MRNADARFNNSLRPRKPEGSLGRTAQDGHLDSHTAPELWQRLCRLNARYTYAQSTAEVASEAEQTPSNRKGIKVLLTVLNTRFIYLWRHLGVRQILTIRYVLSCQYLSGENSALQKSNSKCVASTSPEITRRETKLTSIIYYFSEYILSVNPCR